jgi:signal peptidase I
MTQRNGPLLGQVLSAVVGVAVLAIVARTWLIEGLATRVVVASGSMAPHLLGPHLQFSCPECGGSFVCDRESALDASEVICPQCGTTRIPTTGVDRPGDRVLMDRSAYLWRTPRRWEVVVLETDDNPGALAVKRVAGLPGEVVELRGGDVWVNGAIARKEIADCRAMAVPVYSLPEGNDNRDQVERRWQCEPPASWEYRQGRLAHRVLRPSEPLAWLTYQHRQCFRSPESVEPGVMLDESAYDPSESRVLNPISDVTLRCRLWAASGEVHWRIGAGWDPFVFELNFDLKQGTLVHNGHEVASAKLSDEVLRHGARWEVMLADHRLYVVVDDRMLIDHPFQPNSKGAEPGAVLAVGARGGEVELSELQALRDVYYTSLPEPGGASGQYQLGADEYFLLGDNSPHSLDSRVWSRRGGVRLQRILGRALRW